MAAKPRPTRSVALEVYWDRLTPVERAEIAETLKTSVTYLRFLCKGLGGKKASLGFAMAFAAASGDAIAIEQIPLSLEARRQLNVIKRAAAHRSGSG